MSHVLTVEGRASGRAKHRSRRAWALLSCFLRNEQENRRAATPRARHGQRQRPLSAPGRGLGGPTRKTPNSSDGRGESSGGPRECAGRAVVRRLFEDRADMGPFPLVRVLLPPLALLVGSDGGAQRKYRSNRPAPPGAKRIGGREALRGGGVSTRCSPPAQRNARWTGAPGGCGRQRQGSGPALSSHQC